MTFLSVLAAICVLCFIILIHELGHFLAGRAVGLRVDEFCIGFGPKLVKWGKGNTEYSLRAFPLGGACVFHGEDEDNPGDTTAMNNQPVWKRFLTILAGPLANFLLGFVLTVVLLVGIGLPQSVAKVDSTVAGMPAETAGLLPGDAILSINGRDVHNDPYQASEIIQASKGQEARVVIDRAGEQMEYIVPTALNEDGNYAIGIYFATETVRMDFLDGVRRSASFQVEIVGAMLAGFRDLFFAGQGVDDVMGTVGTIAMISSFAQQGLFDLLYLVILISVNVGLFNLLPIPALDGSRLVFLTIEGIRRKPISQNKEAIVHFVGFIALIGLMVVFTYKDIMRLISGGGF